MLASFGALSACHPTEEEYQAKEAEVAQLKAKLSEAEQRGSSLEARLKEMSDNNAQLAERLNIAGTEKGTLERAL
jgi:chromosome segregation ATPase